MVGKGRAACAGLLTLEDTIVATRKLPHTAPFVMSIDEAFDIGVDTRTGGRLPIPCVVPHHLQDREANCQVRARTAGGRRVAMNRTITRAKDRASSLRNVSSACVPAPDP